MAAIGGFPGDSTGRIELEAYGSIPPSSRADQRIAAVLADLDEVPTVGHNCVNYSHECWRHHAGCLAARIRRTLTGDSALTGEDHPQ